MKQSLTISAKAIIAILFLSLSSKAGFSQDMNSYTMGGSNIILPVQKLNASTINNTVSISWQANQQLMAGADAELQRSTDMTEFKTICYIMAPEASELTPAPCGFKDKQAFQLTNKSTVYYRLKLTDKAGNVSYSELVSASLK
jgi:hypothetical protein